MQILKSEQYINEKLDIKPITKEQLNGWKKEPYISNEHIRQCIEENKLKWNPITKCYDCDGNVRVNNIILNEYGKFPIHFGYVKGDFNCAGINLESLDGSPKKVDGNFYCNGNELKTLEGAPEIVGKNFWCCNNRLTSLKGSPRKIGGELDCNYNNLESLDGAPKEVRKLICSQNTNLNLPKAKPKWVKEYMC